MKKELRFIGFNEGIDTNWINCEEELPQNTDNVIVAIIYNNGRKLICVGWYSAIEDEWHVDDNDGVYFRETFLGCDVTHWTPFPKYPEEII